MSLPKDMRRQRLGFREIDGKWCIGMEGNLDTIHDSIFVINEHIPGDGLKLAKHLVTIWNIATVRIKS